MSCSVCESSLDAYKGKKSIRNLRNADSLLQLYVYIILTNIQLFVAISGQSTIPKNWRSLEQNGIGRSPDPFFHLNKKQSSNARLYHCTIAGENVMLIFSSTNNARQYLNIIIIFYYTIYIHY